jgi:hypothetical protein
MIGLPDDLIDPPKKGRAAFRGMSPSTLRARAGTWPRCRGRGQRDTSDQKTVHILHKDEDENHLRLHGCRFDVFCATG